MYIYTYDQFEQVLAPQSVWALQAPHNQGIPLSARCSFAVMGKSEYAVLSRQREHMFQKAKRNIRHAASGPRSLRRALHRPCVCVLACI